MYIRIHEQNLRFRISMEEATNLLNGEKIAHSVRLSPTFDLFFQVSCGHQNSIFEFKDSNRLALYINSNELAQEIEHRPSKSGIQIINDLDNSFPQVNLEVDIKRKKKSQSSQRS